MSAGQENVFLRNALLADGTRSDIHIQSGKIAGFRTMDGIDATSIDLAGRLVVPALVDAHIHLDKTLLGLPWHPHLAENSVRGRIAAEKDLRRTVNLDVAQSGAALLSLALANGTTAVRSHVDIDDVTGLRHVEALLRLRETWRDLVDIQLVAFPQSGIQQCPGVAELLRDAIEMGCDLVGGLDPIGIDRDLDGHLDTIFALAERYTVGVDIHLHDPGEGGLGEILAIADRTKALGLLGRVTVSHAFCLGSVPPELAGRAADQLANAGVAILTSAPGAAPMPPVSLLRKAGVRVVAGSDNVRDAWSPFGNASMLERCWLIAYRSGYRTDDEISSTFDLATTNAATLLGLDRELKVGRTADLIALPSSTLSQAVVERPRPDLVIRRGCIVHCAFALPPGAARVRPPTAASLGIAARDARSRRGSKSLS